MPQCCGVCTCIFRCCLIGTICPVLIVIRTDSDRMIAISITLITNSKCCITSCFITSTNCCSSTFCCLILITYSQCSVPLCCIGSTNRYFTIITSYIVSCILVTYNNRVLTYIIITTIESWFSICPNIYMTITSIHTSHSLLRRNTAHSTSDS